MRPTSVTFTIGLIFGYLSLRLLLTSMFSVELVSDSVTYEKNRLRAYKVHTEASQKNNSAVNPPNSTRILCWIMTGPRNLESRTKHVKQTWGKHCHHILYMSSVKTDFPTVELNVSEGRENLYWKTIRALQYIHQHHQDKANWFLKADDDTFVVIENLQYILSKLDPEKPLYLGRRFKPFISQGYMSGGAGYVLSKEALKRFVKGFQTGQCTHFSTIEDMALGKCMETMKVEPVDTRDVKGRQTFHAFPLDHYIIRQLPRPRPWYMIYDYYVPNEGPNCCSDFIVSFHYIYPVQQYVLEYFTYHLRPYGYLHRFRPEEIVEENNKTNKGG
ncbi:glycoprotein-N-acetylgalactosamine 3-beta-galactosyltransferase 1 [Poecilia latipinna]|uniref:glycoprotein-N-acetylgalactosamine 3-beta-galactosyltransferase 1 n=1 Tax=Poecilia latipinna TaxID=48699 RepID=UPI00072E1E1C|nr:PREDICTED: glycoprotein-N-acetylgalactosamine 3-beta-galactosyltransferase 1-like [Poecilia latipinna]XP_014877247.1 PREDICTED: glycoprotein-N-acetylgalactosamine 3-beta-galactosyltransferase 1-like [Poecilia latipinna]